ncbi:hypothetical protein VT52_006215 [Streptomyces malaysiense]|uniref:Uncharacterized protein n=1 Tax=Streptomyces malaysiense TaxID=1428626 RepID=A0A1J4Q5G4_9ACTN|nr:hypothetical protein VT52_006215 [Streptomyces malaysiense]
MSDVHRVTEAGTARALGGGEMPVRACRGSPPRCGRPTRRARGPQEGGIDRAVMDRRRFPEGNP